MKNSMLRGQGRLLSVVGRSVAAVFALLLVQCRMLPAASVQALDGESDAPVLEEPSKALAGNAWLEIDPRAFEENIRALTAMLGDRSKLCAILKADAYGHGIALLGPSVVALGVPCVGIASNEDARLARAAGFTKRLMRIRTATPEELEEGLRFDVEETLGNLELARAASGIAQRHGKALRVHLALNSGGMSRNGIETMTAEGRRDALSIVRLPGLEIAGIMTHFALDDAADVRRRLRAFNAECAWLIEQGGLSRGRVVLHAANSVAALEVPESRLDLVRAGAALYGEMALAGAEPRPVMKLKSSVAVVNAFPAGDTVSYDGTFTLQRDSSLANVPVGYSDGYLRTLSNRGIVLIRGRRYPIVGRVTMNTIMVDVTGAPDVRPGDEVVLFGKQGDEEITQDEIEEMSGTILAELQVLWGAANPRVLRDEE